MSWPSLAALSALPAHGRRRKAPDEEDAATTTAALRATQKTLRAGARARSSSKPGEGGARCTARKAETDGIFKSMLLGDAAERARVEAEARAAKQRDALSARIADLENSWPRATSKRPPRARRARRNRDGAGDAAAQDVDDDSPRGVARRSAGRASSTSIYQRVPRRSGPARAACRPRSRRPPKDWPATSTSTARTSSTSSSRTPTTRSTQVTRSSSSASRGAGSMLRRTKRPALHAMTSSLCVTLTSPPNGWTRRRPAPRASASRPSSPWPTPSMCSRTTIGSASTRRATAPSGSCRRAGWTTWTACRAPRSGRHAAGATVVVLELNGDEDVRDAKLALEQLGGDEGRRTLLFARRLRKLSVRVDDDVRVLANVDEAYRVFRRGDAVVAFGQTPTRGWAHATLPICALPRSFGFSVNAPFDVVASRGALRTSAANVAAAAADFRRGPRRLPGR